MTTIAYDGQYMVCDELATDCWGLKEYQPDKIFKGSGCAVGCAGETGVIYKWWKTLKQFYETKEPTFEQILDFGYPDYERDKNDPSLMLVNRIGEIYRHSSGIFIIVQRKFFAIGSGRDFALAAMHCGKTAHQAVQIAAEFDNNTGYEMHHWER
jgi:ATP-dependent protease HslVU (ClpYQ) peptidase subunit